MFVLGTVTDGAETVACKRALPMPLDAVNVKFQDPLIGVAPCFALAITTGEAAAATALVPFLGSAFLSTPTTLNLLWNLTSDTIRSREAVSRDF
jgi:hypothetical protein